MATRLKRRTKMIEYLKQPIEFTVFHGISLGFLAGSSIGYLAYIVGHGVVSRFSSKKDKQ